MLRKTFTNVLAVTLLFTTLVFSQTYQGPAAGSVTSGAIVNTNSFPDFPISGDSDPIIRGEVNLQGLQTEPMIIESDESNLLPVTYVEDKNVNQIDNPALVGDNSMLLEKFMVDLDNNVIPPDPTIAVGPNHVMVLTNNATGIRIYDKQGNLLKSINSNQWWSAVWPNQLGDPQIFYDHYANRWFMLFMQYDDIALTAGNLIAYSDDDDPLGTWYMYRLDTKTHGTTTSNTWGDYPQIGFDEQAIVIMTRCFTIGGGGPNYTKLRIISKAELYASNAGALTYKDIWDITLPGSSIRPDVIHPSFQFGTAGEHYLLYANRSGGNFYTLYKLTNLLTTPVLTAVNISVPFYGQTPDANQLGGGTPLIAANGSHMKTAPVYRDGYIYATHSIRNSVYPLYASIKYVKIDVATNTVVESAELGADRYFYIYPAIAVDKDGNIAITCSRSGDAEYIGAYYTTRRATDPPGLGNSKVLQPGLGNYIITFGGTRNRWGDYLGVHLDPTDEYSMWMVSEYASGTNAYDCYVGQVRLEPFQGIYVNKDRDSIDFGPQEINTSSDTVDVLISNYGVDSLVINNIANSQGDFHLISSYTFPVTINTFDSLYFKFAFSPTSLGQQSVIYPIDNNSGTFSSIELKGLGYEMFPAANKILYGISGVQNNGNLLFVDTTTGVGTNLGLSNFTNFNSLTIHPITNQIYGIISNALGSDIYKINAQTGEAYIYRALDVPNIYSVAFDKDLKLYGTTSEGEIRLIDIQSGTNSLVSSTPIFPLAITFNPLNNELWGSYRKGFGLPKDLLVKIDLLTGDTTNVGATGFGVNTVDLEFTEDGLLYGVKGSGNTVSDLFRIDTLSGAGTLIGSTGLKDIRSLGFSLGELTNIDNNENKIIPNDFVLEQNYPNPFNPSTQIKFSLPVASNVKVVIYNLIGEVVTELVNTQMNSGVHSINWYANDNTGKKVSSGVYFYELKANGVDGSQFNQIKKMMLLK